MNQHACMIDERRSYRVSYAHDIIGVKEKQAQPPEMGAAFVFLASLTNGQPAKQAIKRASASP